MKWGGYSVGDPKYYDKVKKPEGSISIDQAGPCPGLRYRNDLQLRGNQYHPEA